MDSFDKIFCMLNLLFFFITLSHGWYLHVVCVIWNSKSVQLILFKLCTVFIYIFTYWRCSPVIILPQTKTGGIKESRPSVCLSIQFLCPGIYQCIKMHTLLECFAGMQVQTRYWPCSIRFDQATLLHKCSSHGFHAVNRKNETNVQTTVSPEN